VQGVRRAAGLVALLMTVACTPFAAEESAQRVGPAAAPDRTPGVRPVIEAPDLVLPERPNIVLVLLDDADVGLLATMRHAQALAGRGATYPHAYVVDSLCCPSRASLLTGQYPHQTGVLINTSNLPNEHGPIGGWKAFRTYGNLQRSVNVRLHEAGYTTGFVGKFLNQYERPRAPLPAPPGWTEWHALLYDAYDGWDFTSVDAENGGPALLHDHPAPPETASDAEKDAAYAGTVTQEQALDFIAEHQPGDEPYFLEVTPYATHTRVSLDGHYPDDPVFPPAMQDRPRPGRPDGNCGLLRCSDLTLDDLPGYQDDPTDNVPRYADGSPAPSWRPSLPPATELGTLTDLRNRARMVQSVDRMIGALVEAVDDETIVVVTSDNGYHLGQFSLGRGKATPYRADVRVPLLVAGPGIRPGARDELVSNIDLAPTFEELAGLTPAPYRSGRSLLPSLRDPGLRERQGVIIEHTWGKILSSDPDRGFPGSIIDDVPSYVAVHGRHGLLVRLDLDNSWEGTDPVWEYYDYRTVGWERTNQYGDPRYADDIRRLRRVLAQFDRCSVHTRDDAVPARCR